MNSNGLLENRSRFVNKVLKTPSYLSTVAQNLYALQIKDLLRLLIEFYELINYQKRFYKPLVLQKRPVQCCAIFKNICFSPKDYTEQLSVLAVQAYAEKNTWQEVLPFVQKVYGDIEHSPAAVIQLW